MSKYVYLILLFILIANKSFSGIYGHRTFVLLEKEYPAKIISLKPSAVYVTYSGNIGSFKFTQFLKGDTIQNLRGFLDSSRYATIGYRLVFYKMPGAVDSLYQLDYVLRIQFKVFPRSLGLALIQSYDTLTRVTDIFLFDYNKKTKNYNDPSFNHLARTHPLYESYDRNNFTLGSVWMVSIGIDDYEGVKYKTCKSDAVSYIEYFENQLWGLLGTKMPDLFHGFLLLDKDATKDSIIKVLKHIIRNATVNDYFIFNFSGSSRLVDTMGKSITYFDTYGVNLKMPLKKDSAERLLLSLQELQDLFQFIPSKRQLYISEAGPSKKFKAEFIQTLIKNSPDVAGLLNKNRIIIVPDSIGYEGLQCDTGFINKGPINYYITSLAKSHNIYDLFEDNYRSANIAFQLKAKDYECKPIENAEYFDVFFEKKFLDLYRELLGDSKESTRGGKESNQNLSMTAGLTGKKYALVIGTDNYRSKSWKKLYNPILDVKAIAGELRNSYGFAVNELYDAPLDSVYNALKEYYQMLKDDDQLIIYFAGHGDFDEGLLDDGFIVCTDSKAVTDDPMRNSYIPHTRLKRMINKMPAKQILVILDICHGGVFDEEVLGSNMREDPNSSGVNMSVIQFLEEKAKYKSRRVLSSVGKEAAFDGKAGKNSPFANLFLQMLRGKGGIYGVIPLAKLYSFLQENNLSKDIELKISPHMARFGNDDSLGDFIFIPVATVPESKAKEGVTVK